jgi:hypothetical protein
MARVIDPAEPVRSLMVVFSSAEEVVWIGISHKTSVMDALTPGI